MRAKWRVGLMTVAVAVPFGAQAGNQATRVSDLWDSGRIEGLPVISRLPTALDPRAVVAESPSDAVAAVLHARSNVRAVDTFTRRGNETAGSGGGVSVIAPTRVAPAGTTPPAAAAAPEMNAGFAATGLTLLFGGVAILRSRRNRYSLP
jgi:hypothetical protein